MNTTKIILVTGATGHQGGAVAKALLDKGFQVRALTRDPIKPAAEVLTRRGAQVVRGDLNDRASISDILRGVYGVFSVQTFFEQGTEGEVLQGKLLAEEAKAAGIEHFIYSSVVSADKKTGVPHFESKWQIEEHIRSLGLKATIFRPVFFMYNFNSPQLYQSILNGTLPLALKPETKLYMLAVEDHAAFVAMAFEKPNDYMGKAIELAGDVMTMPEAADVLSRVMNRPVKFVEVPISEVRKFSADLAKMFQWFNEQRVNIDIKALRNMHPGLRSFEAWLRETGWSRLEQKRKAG
ncbi:MAG: NmrA/HSCARG family protein [Deltaproteobacteria bacterium]|nr:NmrA/HSCARG family protein [Deltaproteobacteria bacterium]